MLSCLTLCDPMNCSSPGSSGHGILQARILELVAISSSRGSSQPRNQNSVDSLSPKQSGKPILQRIVGIKRDHMCASALQFVQMWTIQSSLWLRVLNCSWWRVRTCSVGKWSSQRACAGLRETSSLMCGAPQFYSFKPNAVENEQSAEKVGTGARAW